MSLTPLFQHSQDMHAGGEEEADLADVEQFTAQLTGAAEQPRAQQLYIAFSRVPTSVSGALTWRLQLVA